VLKLPLTALFRNGDTWAVFIDDQGVARKREVTLGHRTGLQAEIVDGLSAGERIVLHPSDKIAEGVRIEARQEQN
jgi:HlyD family secretion protein